MSVRWFVGRLSIKSSLCYIEHHYMLEEATVPQVAGQGGCLVGLEVQKAGLWWVLGKIIRLMVDYEGVPA